MNLPWDLCMHMGHLLLSILIIHHLPSLTMILLDIIRIPHHPCLLPLLGPHCLCLLDLKASLAFMKNLSLMITHTHANVIL